MATTSAVASAMIGPSFGDADDPVAVRERVGIDEFTALAGQEGTGVAVRHGRLATRWSEGPPLPGLQPCSLSELPVGFGAGAWGRLPLVDMPIYLSYLVRRLEAAGGRIEQAEVTSLSELAGQTSLIANCAGLGARELASDPAVRPVRGQQVVVDNPGVEEFFVSAPFEPAWTAYWPYPDHVIVGGSQDEDDETMQPDPSLAEEMLSRCVEIEPRLGSARVLAHQVGLRPARPTVRLEAEQISGARCVHNYGHGGSGVTTSWGCARAAVALLTETATGADAGLDRGTDQGDRR